MTQEERDELNRLAQFLIGLAEDRAEGAKQPTLDLPSKSLSMNESELLAVAQTEIARRASRERHLPSDLFGEGGWNILLDLYVSDFNSTPVYITDACVASGLPSTTALRHIAYLIESRLARRLPDSQDQRRQVLQLTNLGRQALSEALQSMAAV